MNLEDVEFPCVAAEQTSSDPYAVLKNLEEFTVRYDLGNDTCMPVFIQEAARRTKPGRLESLLLPAVISGTPSSSLLFLNHGSQDRRSLTCLQWGWRTGTDKTLRQPFHH